MSYNDKKIKSLSEEQFSELLITQESDFFDFKSKRIDPKELQKTIVSFANSEGGEICIWLEDKKNNWNRLNWFKNIEESNPFMDSIYRDIIPSISWINHEFVEHKWNYLLFVKIPSSRNVHNTSSWDCYIRAWAEKIQLKNQIDITALKYKKWEIIFEDEVKNIPIELITKSSYFVDFLKKDLTRQTPYEYLYSNCLVIEKYPKISAILFFMEKPQFTWLKCWVKIYRYWFKKTSRLYKYDRNRIEEEIFIEGNIENLIRNSIKNIENIFKKLKVKFPKEALLESIVNAVIHRDYSVQDDIKIEIFDNQIEIINPWKFLWKVNIWNDLNIQRFARNPQLYRLLTKLSSFEKIPSKRLNQDRWEGIKTIYSSIRKAWYQDPKYLFENETTIVIFNFASIETYESKIIKYLEKNQEITNKIARWITWEEDKEKIKNLFRKLVKERKIEVVNENAPKMHTSYKLTWKKGFKWLFDDI